jgi:hypothetical protein
VTDTRQNSQNSQGRQFIIRGRVVDARSRRGAHGLRVEAWDTDLLVDDFIGQAEATGTDGRFSIQFDERHFRGLFGERHPDLFFRVLDGKTLLLQTDPLLRGVGSVAGAAPIELPGPAIYDVEIAVDAPASSLAPLHRVHGTLSRLDGCPIAAATVRAYGRALAQEVMLGESTTDTAGRYEIGYAPRHGHEPADAALDALVVRAVDAQLRDTGASGEIGQPGPDEKIDLTIAARLPVVTEKRPGRFIDACRIDLPPGDVVEAVQYEQIIATRNTLAELKGQWGAAWPEISAPAWEAFAACQLGLYLPFEQSWALQGYTRGRMVKSFSLAPGEEQTVEIYTWDRQKSALESTSTAEAEQTTEAAGTRRDALDVSQDVARQTGFQMSTGGKVGFSVAKVVNVDMNQSINATTNTNDHAATASHSIAEATTRASGKVRSSRTVKVTESREFGSEERVTRKLRNTNGFHTLNVPFFEILANYRVTTAMRTNEVKLVVLMPDPLQAKAQPQDRRFGRGSVRQHERALRLALLDRELEPGFDAARMLDAYDRSCNVLCNSCPCPDDPSWQAPNWRRLLNCGKELALAWQGGAAWKEMNTDELNAAAAWLALDEVHGVVDKLTPPHPDHDGFVNRVSDAMKDDLRTRLIQGRYSNDGQARTYIKSHLFRLALRTRGGDLQDAMRMALGDPAHAMTEAKADVLGLALSGLAAADLQALSSDAVVAATVHGIIEAAFRTLAPVIGRLDPLGMLAAAGVAKMLADRVMGVADDFADYDLLGLTPMLKLFGKVYPEWVKELAADDAAKQAAAEQVRTDRKERAARVLAAFGLREIVDKQERLDALLGHLNDDANIDHYRFAIASERKNLFAANEDALKLVAAGVLEALPVGSLGDRFAVPVRLPAGSRFETTFNAIRDALANWVSPDEREHILPTAALYSEAIVGQCNAAEPEALERHRLDMQRHDIDNELQSLEAARLRARLEARPALLDRDPAQPTRIGLEVVGQGGSSNAGNSSTSATTAA